MMTIRRAEARGHADHGWLDTRHTFSFADYLDPRFMGFRGLRVLNDDRVAPGRGFGMHGHRDMEILSYVLEGGLAHRDSTGTDGVLRPGDVQRMSAGAGVRHAEHNASTAEAVHFLQIWLLPATLGLPPSYEQRTFGAEEKRGRLRLIASPDGEAGSLRLHADARVSASLLHAGERAALALEAGRAAWVHVATGEVRVNGQRLSAGDGAALTEEAAVQLEGTRGGEVLVFDLG